MPKEIIRRTGAECHADVMVRWSKNGDVSLRGGDAKVDLFMISQGNGDMDGTFWFEPEHPERFGLGFVEDDDRAGKMIGPVSVDLNREQINRLIRVLRTARDQAYGRDE